MSAMRNAWVLWLLPPVMLVGVAFAEGMSGAEPLPPKVEMPAETKIDVVPLVIVGEGGTSASLFEYAADTYIREDGGVKYTVHDGDEFIRAMQEFVQQHG